MAVVEETMKQTEQMTERSSTLLEKIIGAAEDDAKGEFIVPLSSEKLSKLKTAIEENFDAIDETTVGTAYAIMEKGAKDGQDTIVILIQTVLRLYASISLSRRCSTDEGDYLSEILSLDPDEWETRVRQCYENKQVSEDSFKERLQATMEDVMFAFPVGSYTQRLFAEYLKEFEERSARVFAT